MCPNQQAEDDRNDEAPLEAPGEVMPHIGRDQIKAQASQGFINQVHGPLEQRFGEQQIRNVGGDYAEGDIDKRQGVFITGTVHGNVIGQQTIVAPDPNQQVAAYLANLIAELEKRKGILAYVELAAQADVPQEEAPPRLRQSIVDEWSLEPEFSLLESIPPESASVALPPYKRKKRRLESILMP